MYAYASKTESKGSKKKTDRKKGMNLYESMGLSGNRKIAQLAVNNELVTNELNVVGEAHSESNKRRKEEKEFCKEKTNSDNYWREYEFEVIENKGMANEKKRRGDPFTLRADTHINAIDLQMHFYETGKREFITPSGDKQKARKMIETSLTQIYSNFLGLENTLKELKDSPNDHSLDVNPEKYASMYETVTAITVIVDSLCKKPLDDDLYKALRFNFDVSQKRLHGVKQFMPGDKDYSQKLTQKDGALSKTRSALMFDAAVKMRNTPGVWKIGNNHFEDMTGFNPAAITFNLVSRDNFNNEYAPWYDNERKRQHEMIKYFRALGKGS